MNQKTFASMGGKASAAKLTPEERSARALKGGLAVKAKFGPDYFSNIRKGIKAYNVEK